MIEVYGDDCLQAWRCAVARLLAERRKAHNLFVLVNRPNRIEPSWLQAYDPRTVIGSAESLSNVANTIFPERAWTRAVRKGWDRTQFYDRYKQIYQRGKRIGWNRFRNRTAWGTYFLRLTDFGAQHVNQLDDAIKALTSWGINHRAAVTFHLCDPNTDKYRPSGGPCWHFGELSAREDRILDFTAVYRSHDYFQKALGNFIGLSRLLCFICDQTGKTPGTLCCHSVYAWTGTSDRNMRTLARLQ